MNIYLAQFLTVAIIHLLAVASPGPDFAIVVKQSVVKGRRKALFTSLGVGTGILFHVSYSLLGVGLLVSKSILAFNIMKYLGASYLFYIGWKSLRATPAENEKELALNTIEDQTDGKAYFTGLFVNVLNPKATLFFISLFSVIIRPETPYSHQVFYGIYMAFTTALWFSLVAVFFSNQRVSQFFKRFGYWFDRIMGGILIALGLKLIASHLK